MAAQQILFILKLVVTAGWLTCLGLGLRRLILGPSTDNAWWSRPPWNNFYFALCLVIGSILGLWWEWQTWE